MDYVLDPTYYGGKCEYVYNGEWRKFTYDAFCESLQYRDDEKNYRKPYNYHSYRFVVLLNCSLLRHVTSWSAFAQRCILSQLFDLFQADGTSEGSEEYYEDAVDFLKARKKSSSSNAGVSFGISFVEVGVSGSREREFLQNITQFRSQVGSIDPQADLFCHKYNNTFMFLIIFSLVKQR